MCIFRSFAIVAVATSKSNGNTFFDNILLGVSVVVIVGRAKSVVEGFVVVAVSRSVIIGGEADGRGFASHQASLLTFQHLAFVDLGSGSRDGERETHVAPFVGNGVGFVADESRAVIGILVAGDIAEEGDAADEQVLHDEHVNDNSEEDGAVDHLEVGVTPGGGGIAADDGEGDEGTEGKDDGEDVSTHVLNADGGDGRGASKHHDGAGSTEPPHGDTEEVGDQTSEAGGAVGPAVARRAARLLFRERGELGGGVGETDGRSGVDGVGDDVVDVGNTAGDAVVGHGSDVVEAGVDAAEVGREVRTHRLFAGTEDAAAEGAHVCTAAGEVGAGSNTVGERTEGVGVVTVVHTTEVVDFRVLARVFTAEVRARVGDGLAGARVDDGATDGVFISISVFEIFVNADEQGGTAAEFLLVVQGSHHLAGGFTLGLADDVEVVAMISITVEHGDVVDDDAEDGSTDGGEGTDVGPHFLAVAVGNAEGVLEDENDAADEATDVSEGLGDLDGTGHDVEGPEDAHPDVEREVSIPGLEPDRRKDETTALLEVVDESENDADTEEGENNSFENDLSDGGVVFTDTEIEDPTASLTTL